MGTPTYQAFGLLEPDNNFEMNSAAEWLAAGIGSLEISRTTEDKIQLVSGGWEITIGINREPWVGEESKELATALAHSEKASRIARCQARVEIQSESPDPDMDHFNDYIAVLEVLETFDGVILVDPREPDLI